MEQKIDMNIGSLINAMWMVLLTKPAYPLLLLYSEWTVFVSQMWGNECSAL
jgi:hypothetical protein